MRGFILRTLISSFGLWLAARLVPSIEFDSEWVLLGAAVLLGVVNAVVRPVAIFLTLPATVVTLGLFLLVVNAGMLGLVAWLLEGFRIGSFGAAFLGALIVSFTGWLGSAFISPRGRVERVYVQYGTTGPYGDRRVEKVVEAIED